MASETTELTFVRCPSCRSLVPASAARCRICNSPLENGAKSEDTDPNKNASRVRQNTMSADPNEVAAAIATAQSENAKVHAAVDAPPPVSSSASASDSDPLGAYLQEADDTTATADAADPLGLMASDGTSADAPASSEGINPFGDDVDDDSWGVPPTQKQHERARESSTSFLGKVDEAIPTSAPEITKSTPPFDGRSEERREASGRGVPPAFPRTPEERKGPSGGPMRPERDRSGEMRPPKEKSEGRSFGGAQPSGRRDEPRKDQPRREERERAQQRDEQRPVQKHTERSAPEAHKGDLSKLFGWLVSYETPQGKATELRQGRFFVTASSIKSSDLVIENPSISTPHALMAINPERGVQVQDLMSEQGIFIRKGDAGEYKREEGTVMLKHGDWLKFGSVEYLVALLPYAEK